MKPRYPFTGDDCYWFHLVPKAEVANPRVHPPQDVLLAQPMVPFEMDLYHTYFVPFLSWIPTAAGCWEAVPAEVVVIDGEGATQARRVFQALRTLFSAAPEQVPFPIPKMLYSGGAPPVHRTTVLKYLKEDLVTRMDTLAEFSTVVQTGSHVLFFSYWLQR